MKTVQLEDDVYSHLLKNVRVIGEDASSILRRLLNVPTIGRVKTGGGLDFGPIPAQGPTQVDECMEHPRFQMEREAVGRFLFCLSWLSKKHGTEFRKVLEIRGRRRRYFSEDPGLLEESGRSVQPRQIPDTSFWVVTNNDTPKKKRMLSDVMRVLGYPASDVARLTEALE